MNWIVKIIQGALIGAGGVFPGVSGGVLAVLFGVYKPLMRLLAHPIKELKRSAIELWPIIVGFLIAQEAQCGRRDLNPYPLLDTPLKRARMPIPPRPHAVTAKMIIPTFTENVKGQAWLFPNYFPRMQFSWMRRGDFG